MNKRLPLKERLKRFLYYYFKRRGSKVSWRRRFNKVFKLNADYNFPAEKKIEKEYKDYWKDFEKKPNPATLRISKNISGIANSHIIPEEIFVTDIEPTLNRNRNIEFLSYKSLYDRWFPDSIFPKGYIHNVEGEWLNEKLNAISYDEVIHIASILKYPVVFKPNKDSYGGKGVFFPENIENLINLMDKHSDFVVQEHIIQHFFFQKFNHHGLNTLRVCLYKSVVDNKIHAINVALRIGVGGSLDNETAGGIVTFVDQNGGLNGYAVDKFGRKYFHHPDTHLTFTGKVPYFEKMVSLSKDIGHKIFYARISSIDLILDCNDNWRVIEINLFGQTIRFAQYAGQPFFGKFTDEVVEYSRSNHWALY